MLVIVGSTSSGREKSITVTEKWMILFMLWSILVSLQHYDVVDFKTYIKWILPLLTYMVMKRTIINKQ